MGEVGLPSCLVCFCILSVLEGVGDGRRWPEAVPPFPFGQILDMRPGEAHRPRDRRNEMLSAVFNQVTAIPAPVVSRNGRLLPPDTISGRPTWCATNAPGARPGPASAGLGLTGTA